MNRFPTESAYPMIPWEEAWAIVAETIAPLAPVEVGLTELLGLVLAEDVVSSENMPPFAASSMDGYAVIASDTTPERRVIGEQDAGRVLGIEVTLGTAVRIMTGAPLPRGADAVIPVEHTSETGALVRLEMPISPGQSVRLAGKDIAVDDLVVAKGTVLGPAEIGILAMIGHAKTLVHPRPRVAVMATGDELVPQGEPLRPGQIRDSNSYALCAAAQAAGGIAHRTERIVDSQASLREALLRAIEGADMVVTSGGVSMGTRDLLKPVLADLGTVHFGRVAVKPGKPFTFATVKGVPVFGLPGFPVSSLVTFENAVRPAIRIMAGHKALWRPELEVRLSHAVRHAPDRMEFQRAVIARRDGVRWATTTGSQVSSRLKSLVGADALLRIPGGVGNLEKGDSVKAILVNQPEVRQSG